jgi:hypothetical protein
MYDYMMIFLFMFPPNYGLEKEPTSRFFLSWRLHFTPENHVFYLLPSFEGMSLCYQVHEAPPSTMFFVFLVGSVWLFSRDIIKRNSENKRDNT